MQCEYKVASGPALHNWVAYSKEPPYLIKRLLYNFCTTLHSFTKQLHNHLMPQNINTNNYIYFNSLPNAIDLTLPPSANPLLYACYAPVWCHAHY